MRLPHISTDRPAGVPFGLRWLEKVKEQCPTASGTAIASVVIDAGLMLEAWH
jgi:hypothetical protein